MYYYMTHVNTSSVRRAVDTLGRSPRALVVLLSPEGAWIREKGRRTAYLLPYGAAFDCAAKLHANAERRTKLAERASRRAK